MIVLQVAVAGLVLLLWWAARPVVDPFRIRAKTASQLSEHEWSRMWILHGVEERVRSRQWKRERREWLRRLALHLAACEERWRHDGWKGVPRVLTFHRRYTEPYGQEAQQR